MALADLMASELPLNRKERFYTGTVFPMIVARDGFRHFSRFTALLDGYDEQPIDARPASANIQFFTEYSLVESIYGFARGRFPNPPMTKDTPDIPILVRGEKKVLIALEAKLYDRPRREDLARQMAGQAVILNYLRDRLCLDKIHHCALLPEALAKEVSPLAYPIITWEQLWQQYRPVLGGDYFLAVLELALSCYDDLVARPRKMGQNGEARVAGVEILERFLAGDRALQTIGRRGGPTGPQLDVDIRSGRWREREYEVSRKESPPNRNWFQIADFVARILAVADLRVVDK